MTYRILALGLLALIGCSDISGPSSGSRNVDFGIPPGLDALLWGSSSRSTPNPASLFTIDAVTGAATLIGSAGVPEGSDRISGVDFHPITGRLYGIKGGACHGAILIILDPATALGTIVDTLRGGWFDGTPGSACPGGSDGLAFGPDGSLYAAGWYGGIPQGKIMRVDPETGTVLEVHPTPIGFDDWRGRRAHLSGLAVDANGTLWISRGSSAVPGQLNTVDPATGNITSTLYLTDPGGAPEDSITISDIAFAPDDNLYASLPWENMLATIDTSTGVVTRIGGYGPDVNRMSGLTAVPRLLYHLTGRYWFNEAESGQGPTGVADDQANPVDLSIDYNASLVWSSQGGHRGLSSTDFSHRALTSADVIGTKYETALDNADQATFALVASWSDPPYTTGVAGFQTAGVFPRRVAMFHTDDDGQPFVVFRTKAQGTIDVRWPLPLADGVRRAFHVVYDAQDPVPERRIRLYVDGVDQGGGQLSTGDWPAPGEGLDFNESNLQLQILQLYFLFWAFPPQGTVYYYGVYDTALTDAEIAGNAGALLNDDDNLP